MSRFNKHSAVDQLKESELIEGCVRQDVDYQRILYNRFANKMMGVCLRYCNSQQEAEDVIQESFIKVFEKIKTFKSTGSLEGWIKRIVINSALKSNDKRVRKFEPGSMDSIVEPAFDPRALSKMETKDILNVIKKLPDGYRTVFNLYAIEGYSHKEIAHKLNISEVTSRTQYARAKKQLIKMLKLIGIERE